MIPFFIPVSHLFFSFSSLLIYFILEKCEMTVKTETAREEGKKRDRVIQYEEKNVLSNASATGCMFNG